jgi:hypothetical protein
MLPAQVEALAEHCAVKAPSADGPSASPTLAAS